MPTVRYIGPIDEVDVVGGGIFKTGDEREVSDEQAESLLRQTDNFTGAASAFDVMTVDELRDLAAEKSVDLTGLTKKADIVAAIKKG